MKTSHSVVIRGRRTTRAARALRQTALGVAGARGADTFESLVRHLALALDVDFALIGVLTEDAADTVETVAAYQDGGIVENYRYALTGTPCHDVVGQRFRYFRSGVQARFPDPHLAAEGIIGYAAIPLFDSAGGTMGLMAALNRAPLLERDIVESVLEIFSVRAAAELERVRTDAARQVSEASYRAMFEGAEDAVFVHDRETGAIVDVNPKACSAYGYSSEEFKTMDVGALSSGEHPFTLPEAQRRLAQARAGTPVRFEWHRRNKDGSLHWDEVVLKRAVIAGTERILAFTREITERKEAEDALRASEEEYRAIFNASVDGLALWTPQGRLVDVNPAFWRMHGYSREEFFALEPRQFIHADSHPAYDRFLASVGSGTAFHTEARNVRKDGSTFDVEVHGVPVHHRGEPHLLAIVRDLTPRKQAEEERMRLEAQLRQAQKMEAIGHLTGGIAHDFNNILTGIMGYVLLALERQERYADATLSRYLEQANRSAQRARDLIRQMLTFSRGQRGAPRALALAPLVKESVKLLASSLPSSVEFQLELADDGPTVLADPVQIEQVLMNLCINAGDAMGGSGEVQIRVRRADRSGAVCASCRQPFSGSFIELAVCDRGPGIPSAIAERVFEPFFTTKDAGKGSGMGLSVVHGIVHEHGGHIDLQTGCDAGSSFHILLPALAQAATSPPRLSPASPSEATRRPALCGRVLVVDDDDTVADFMRDLLETWGLDVTICTTSPQAEALYARDPYAFDLVVTDQVMPKLTGIGLAQRLLAHRPGLPIIVYSGYSDEVSERRMRELGVRAVIRKPVDVEALRDAVSVALTDPLPPPSPGHDPRRLRRGG